MLSMTMSMFRSFASYGLRSSTGIITRYRLNGFSLVYSRFSPNRGMQSSGDNRRMHSTGDDRRVFSKRNIETIQDNNDKVHVPTLHSPKGAFPTWARWAMGTILSLFFPFWKKKWEKFLQIEDEVVKVVEVVENAAEVVEKVATMVEKVSSEVAEKLPEDGKLKDAALFVERVSKEAAKDAQLAQNVIHKVDELKQGAETLLEPVLDQEKSE